MTDQAPADPAHNVQFAEPDPMDVYVKCVQYERATGKIIQWDCTMQKGIFDNPEFNPQDKPFVLGSGHPDTHFVVSGIVFPRADMNLVSTGDTLEANGVDSVVISNIPDGSVATIGSQSMTVTGGSLGVTTTEQGVLTLRVTPPTIQYRESVITLQAT